MGERSKKKGIEKGIEKGSKRIRKVGVGLEGRVPLRVTLVIFHPVTEPYLRFWFSKPVLIPPGPD